MITDHNKESCCNHWVSMAIIFVTLFVVGLQVRYHYKKESENKDWLEQIQTRIDDETNEIKRSIDIDKRWKEFFKSNPDLKIPPSPWPYL